MRIGELARRAGVSTRALRYYEQQGLITARRSANGYREYGEADLRLVSEIRSLLAVGFTLDDARPFVACLRAGHDSGGRARSPWPFTSASWRRSTTRSARFSPGGRRWRRS